MRTVQEIEEQLREERDHVSQLYAQVSVCEKHMEQLKSEIEIAKNYHQITRLQRMPL